jgi:hypothetical protein
MPPSKHLKNILVLKTGESLVGQVLNAEFTLKTSFGTLKFKPKQIVHIHFAGAGFPVDDLQLISGDRIRGEISPPAIAFRLAASDEEVQVPKEQIHTAVFLDSV